MAQGKPDDAEPLYRLELQLRLEKLGTTHPETLASMSNLTCLLRLQGKLDEELRLRDMFQRSEEFFSANAPCQQLEYRSEAQEGRPPSPCSAEESGLTLRAEHDIPSGHVDGLIDQISRPQSEELLKHRSAEGHDLSKDDPSPDRLQPEVPVAIAVSSDASTIPLMHEALQCHV